MVLRLSAGITNRQNNFRRSPPLTRRRVPPAGQDCGPKSMRRMLSCKAGICSLICPHWLVGMIQMCYHTNHCACWPCFVNMRVFICYKTVKGTLMLPSFTRVTLRVLALLGQVTW